MTKAARRILFVSILAALLPLVARAGSGFTVNGVDLDNIFAPYHTGWPQAALTGFTVNGVDLRSRYAPLSTGSSASATGFKIAGGADLNTVFAALGSTGVQVGTQPSAVSGSAAAGNPSGTVTSNSTTVAGKKGSGSYSFTWHIASGAGASFTNPSGAATGVTGTVNAGSTISGTMYCSISDGVTSANTNSVSWSLQNTTPPSWNFQLNAGEYPPDVIGYYPPHFAGSVTGGTFGSLTVSDLHDVTNLGNSFLFISGFSSDPGQNSLTSIVANGVTKLGSTALYSYSGGEAQWEWAGPSNLFGFANGVDYPVVIKASFIN